MWSGRTGFAIDVDLIDHEVIVALHDGRIERVALRARPVADFYHELIGRLRTLDIEPAITEAQAAGRTSLRQIAAYLNEQSIQTPRGKLWTPTAVKNALEQLKAAA